MKKIFTQTKYVFNVASIRFQRLRKSPSYFLIALMFISVLALNSLKAQTPSASFSVMDTVGCVPMTVDFTNTSTNASSYFWNFGNGNTSTLPNPSNVYLQPGTYTVTLVASDTSGKKDTLVKTNFITVVKNPVANFSANDTAVCPGIPITFTSTSQYSDSVVWDFGDGNTSSDPIAVHQYTLSGNYTVKLIALSQYGCNDVMVKSSFINVQPSPEALFSSSQFKACDTLTTFNFSNSSLHSTNYKWYFGTGDSSVAANPGYPYQQQGTFDVTLIAMNSIGCFDTLIKKNYITIEVPQVPQIIASITQGCAPEMVNFDANAPGANAWNWNLGDGTISNKKSLSNTYTVADTFYVSLSIQTAIGCSATVAQPKMIVMQPRPVAGFTVNDTVGCAPLTVGFTNFSTPGATATWSYGDGDTTTGWNPDHIYNDSGKYDIRLLITSPNGCTSMDSIINAVNVYKLSAGFTASPSSGCIPLPAQFSSKAFYASSWEWDFGDGDTSTSPNPLHEYAKPGTYDVRLIVNTASGCTDTLVREKYITSTNIATNYRTPPLKTGCVPFTVSFDDATSNSVSWFWDFGDGDTSTAKSPTHVFTKPGLYSVSLVTMKQGGCQQRIDVYEKIQVKGALAKFSYTYDPCPPYKVQFHDSTSGAVSWFWQFDDGTTSTEQHPLKSFHSSGYHSASLTISTAEGCTHTTYADNSIYFIPLSASITVDELDTTYPKRIQFTTKLSGVDSWEWSFGDGSFSTQKDPLHTYIQDTSYLVKFTIMNDRCTTSYEGVLEEIIPLPAVGGIVPHNHRDTVQVKKIISGCPPLSVEFNDTVTGAISWEWILGNGDTAFTRTAIGIYGDPGTYDVKLIVAKSTGVDTILYDSMVVVPEIKADFEVNQQYFCDRTAVMFTDKSTNAAEWDWKFGDGDSTDTRNPVHFYDASLDYFDVNLEVTDTMGCQSFINRTLYRITPDVILSDVSDICYNESVQFNKLLYGNYSFFWDFGDGTTSNDSTPSHVYTDGGKYYVTVVAKDNNSNCMDTFSYATPITVTRPVANFMLNSDSIACDKLEVEFNNTSLSSNSHKWFFGDNGTSNDKNPKHTFNKAGKFDVTLIASQNGCHDTIIKPELVTINKAVAGFTLTQQNDCFPISASYTDTSVNPVSWKWNFKDGTSSTDQNPLHLFTQKPTSGTSLMITDSNGCTKSVSGAKIRFANADFEADVTVGCSPLTVTFTDKSAEAASWLWEFGDGDTSTLQNPTHTYNQNGSFTVRLIITSAANCKDTLVKQDLIQTSRPWADFYTTSSATCAPSNVKLFSSSINANEWLWDFGDGSSSTLKNPSHIYNKPGYYTVKLRIKNQQGCFDSISKDRYIRVLGPISSFTASANNVCNPAKVLFTDATQGAITWEWNFGDGAKSTDRNPSHLYDSSGNYTVSLITTDSFNCQSLYVMPSKLKVTPTPIAVFNADRDHACVGDTVNFNNQSFDGTIWNWNFGDGNTSSLENPSHIYATPGFYTVTLIASTQAGCADTLVKKSILRVTGPASNFTLDDSSGCQPVLVQFGHPSANAYSWNWDFGDGDSSTSKDPKHQYDSAGVYTVKLLVKDSFNCEVTIQKKKIISVYRVPEAAFISNATEGCTPFEVDFTNKSKYHDHSVWKFEDDKNIVGKDIFINTQNASYTYENKGSYGVQLVVSTDNGCFDTASFDPMIINPTPKPAFTSDITKGCNPTTVQFENLTQGDSTCKYSWIIDNDTLFIPNPKIHYEQSGFHDVTLFATTTKGCSDSLKKPGYIEIFDQIPPLASPLHAVSIADNKTVEISWEPSEASDFGNYMVYRLNNTSGNFEQISKLNGRYDTSFTASGLNTLENVYTFVVQTEDLCGQSIELDKLSPHSTIEVKAVAQGDAVRVDWNAYGGCGVQTYRVFRLAQGAGTPELLAELPPNTFTYLDETACPSPYSYRIQATRLCGETYHSYSDTAIAEPADSISDLKVDVVRTTVVDDRAVLTEWEQPWISLEKVSGYTLFRSTDNNYYEEIATLPAEATSYLDHQVAVKTQDYYYMVRVDNRCSIQGKKGSEGSSIVLTAENTEDLNVLLKWSDYHKWKNGVEYFILEKLDKNGTWQFLERLEGDKNSYIDKEE